jgi:hypothetical protein
MHYPSHMRDRFLEWVDAGYPTVAVVERNYEEHEVPAETMLREMLRCSDVLPGDVAEQISEELGLEPDSWRRTYRAAARRLLAVHAGGRQMRAVTALADEYGFTDGQGGIATGHFITEGAEGNTVVLKVITPIVAGMDERPSKVFGLTLIAAGLATALIWGMRGLINDPASTIQPAATTVIYPVSDTSRSPSAAWGPGQSGTTTTPAGVQAP